MNRRQIVTLTPAERLAMKSAPAANGCIEWTAGRTKGGYGQLRVHGRHFLAHRLAWEEQHGPIPDGLVVCLVRQPAVHQPRPPFTRHAGRQHAGRHHQGPHVLAGRGVNLFMVLTPAERAAKVAAARARIEAAEKRRRQAKAERLANLARKRGTK